MEPKFIIECKHNGLFKGQPFYLKKIGPKPWNIEWTNDPYKAKVLDKEQTAIKTADRIHKYIKYCYDAGYSSHSYYVDENNKGVLEDVETKVKEIKLVFINN